MGISDRHIIEFMRNLAFFSGLPEDDIGAFLEAACIRTYSKGENLFLQGDKAQAFSVIISGWIKLYRNTADGEEALVSLLTRGDVFGEAALFGNASYPNSAEAASEVRVLMIPDSVLRSRAKANPEITSRMLETLSQVIQQIQRQNEHMSLMNAPQRVSCLLLQLSSQMIGNGGTITFPYDKSLAAARLGMKPETFSRALAQLQPYGINTKGSEIQIESFKKLSDFSCGHCTAMPGECPGCRFNTICSNGKDNINRIVAR